MLYVPPENTSRFSNDSSSTHKTPFVNGFLKAPVKISYKCEVRYNNISCQRWTFFVLQVSNLPKSVPYRISILSSRLLAHFPVSEGPSRPQNLNNSEGGLLLLSIITPIALVGQHSQLARDKYVCDCEVINQINY